MPYKIYEGYLRSKNDAECFLEGPRNNNFPDDIIFLKIILKSLCQIRGSLK